LFVRPSSNSDSSAAAISETDDGRDRIEEDKDGMDGRLLQSIHATIGSVSPGAIRYGFVCNDEIFHIRFSPGSSVGDARKAVAERFKTQPEAVALHFMGRVLRDGFALDRLRLGTSHISVYVTSDREILLAIANPNEI
jgi:hypothetical protein